MVKTHREVALRVLYLLASFIAITIDFMMKDLSFCEPMTKLTTLNDGLRYGSQGVTGTRNLLELATGLIEQYVPEHRMLAPRIKEQLGKELDSIPTKLLAEYFVKQSVSQDLFLVAKELEGAAYNSVFAAPQTLSPIAKGMLGVLLDFWELDRKSFLLTLNTDDAPIATDSLEQNKSSKLSKQAPLPGLEVKNNDT